MTTPGQAPARPAPLPEIPGYRLEAVIGRGSTGTVYRAVQLAVQRKVALKVLHPELAARGRSIRRLQREARTTAKLAHPGIVSAIDMGHIGSLWWYAMELVEGPSLAAHLRKDGPLSERDAVRLFIPLCEALEHAFEHGVVHRDLKPGNILLDTTGRARIVDLGLAFAEDDPSLTSSGATLGTPHYISPEQARDPGSADVRSDIWSLGATLYHCLCGRPPFAGESVGEILSGVLYSPIPDPSQFAPELSKGMQLVLRKCLARDRDKRYASPREVREDLEALRERRAVSVRRQSLEPLLGERERRRRRWIAGSVAAALAVAGGVAWFVVERLGAPGETPAAARANAAFPALEQLELRAARGGRDLAGALAALEMVRRSLPAEVHPRVDALETKLEQELAAQVRARHVAFQRELDRVRNEERDLIAAVELVETRFPQRLREELGLDATQLAESCAALGLDALRAELEREIEQRVAELVERVRRMYFEEHATRAVEFESRGEWRNARDARRVDARALLERGAVSSRGLPAHVVDAGLDALQQDTFDRARAEVEARWTAGDIERESELISLERQLWAELRLRKVSGAAGKLHERWRELLARDLLDESQFLSDVSDRARTTLERASRELAAEELANDRADAELALADFLPECERAFAAREFARALEAIEAQSARRTMAPVVARLEALRQEAVILEALVQRAAASIERLGESRTPTRFWLAGLERSGVVGEARLPLKDGFRFVTTEGGVGRLLALRPLDGKRFELVGRIDLERLAGLSDALAEGDARFQAALLRARTGEVAAAVELLPLTAPENPDWRALAADLNTRLEHARARQSRELEARRREAANLLFLVRRAAQQNETITSRSQIEQIERLLREFADVDDVKSEAAWLRQRRDELQRGPGVVDADSFRAAFGPNSVELGDGRRVALRFVLNSDYQGQFLRNQWDADVRGWIAPRPFVVDDLATSSIWPTLALRAPLETTGALEVEVTFEQPADAGPPRLFALSLAGVHVLLVGAADEGGASRFALVSGDDQALARAGQALLGRVRGVGVEFKGLQKGARHQLRLALRAGRSKAEVFLDGERLESRALQRSESDESNSSERLLVLRSLERVRVLEVGLRGGY
jgi:tRNA A-37 threonylcarbamoyl transferase component Bud32